MAREKLSAGIEEVNGATSPGHIHRVKRFRDARGRIIGVGVQETYNVKHPRNWKKETCRMVPRSAIYVSMPLYVP